MRGSSFVAIAVSLLLITLFVSSSEASIFGSKPKKPTMVESIKNRAQELRDSVEKTKNRGMMLKKGASAAMSAKEAVDDITDELSDTTNLFKKEVDKTLKGKQTIGDAIERAADIVELKGKRWSENAAQTLRKKKRAYARDIGDTADDLKQKGKKLSKDTAKTLKWKRREWIGDNEVGETIDDIADLLQEKSKDVVDDAAKTVKQQAYGKRGRRHGEEEGWFSGLLSKVRGRDEGELLDEEDDFEELEEDDDFSDLRGSKKKGLLRRRNRPVSKYDDFDEEDEEEDYDEEEGWLDSIKHSFTGKPQRGIRNRRGQLLSRNKGTSAEDIVDLFRRKGKRLSNGAAEKLREIWYDQGEESYVTKMTNLLRGKGKFGDDIDDMIEWLESSLKKKSRRLPKRRRYDDDDEDEDEDSSWRIPLVSDMADKVRSVWSGEEED